VCNKYLSGFIYYVQNFFVDECLFIFYKIGRAIKIGKHPFMGIEYKAVSLFNSLDHPFEYFFIESRKISDTVTV